MMLFIILILLFVLLSIFFRHSFPGVSVLHLVKDLTDPETYSSDIQKIVSFSGSSNTHPTEIISFPLSTTTVFILFHISPVKEKLSSSPNKLFTSLQSAYDAKYPVFSYRSLNALAEALRVS